MSSQEPDDAAAPLREVTADGKTVDSECEPETTTPQDLPQTSSLSVNGMVDAIGLGRLQALVFIAAGLGFCGDSFELLVLSFIMPIFAQDWGLSLQSVALATSVAFAGWLVGSAVWGLLADTFGRKRVFVAVLCSLVGVGLLQLAIVNYPMLLVLRFFMGWAVGGVFVGYTLLAEFLPSAHRVTLLSVFQGFFPLGSVLGSLLAITVLGAPGSWRLLLALGALPIAAALGMALLTPESPRFLAAKNRRPELDSCVAKLARWNGHSLAGKQLVPDESELRVEAVASLPDRLRFVFSRDLALRSVGLFILWFCASFVYYGIVLVSPAVFAAQTQPALSPAASTLLTSAAEVPLLIGGGVLSLYVGRRNLIAGCFFGTAAALGGMVLASRVFRLGYWLLLAVSLCARGLASAAFAVVALLTLEVYPTTARATGFGFCNSMSRIAGVATPWIAIMLGGGDDSLWLPVAVYAACSVAAGAVALGAFVNHTGSAPLQ
jgi:putative MFS transporter